MPNIIDTFNNSNLIPHGYCLQWDSSLLWIHVISDIIIVLSYYSIPLVLLYFLYQRRTIAYPGIIAMFGAFILACGTTHLLGAISVWIPIYWLEGYVKMITALLSISTAAAMFKIIPQALQLPTTQELQQQIDEKNRAQAELNLAYHELEQVYLNINEAIILADNNNIILKINPAFTKITGYNFEEVNGKTPKILHSGKQDNFFYEEMWQNLNGSGYWKGEIWNRRKNGELYLGWLSINTIFNSDGTPYRRVALFSDITERKKAEETLKQLLDKQLLTNQELTEKTEDLRQAYRQLKRKHQELQTTQDQLIQSEKMAALGQLISGIAHEINTPLGAISSSATTLQILLAQILSEIPPLFLIFSKQEYDEFLLILTRVLNHDSNFLSSKELRHKRLELINQLSDKVDDADSIADMLVDMGIYDNITYIIHLLKKPIGQKTVELIYKLFELKKLTQTISTATERASKVIFALKYYAHQNISGEKVLVNVSEGIETILMLYQTQLKNGVKIIKHFADNLPAIVCYSDELNQVWMNLIHNALQAMDYRGTLMIRIQKSTDVIKITIQDTGKGILPENVPKIFDAFFTTKSAGEGSGLGLHIVKKIIDKHAGAIEVESEPGCTLFNVLLPIHNSLNSKNS